MLDNSHSYNNISTKKSSHKSTLKATKLPYTPIHRSPLVTTLYSRLDQGVAVFRTYLPHQMIAGSQAKLAPRPKNPKKKYSPHHLLPFLTTITDHPARSSSPLKHNSSSSLPGNGYASTSPQQPDGFLSIDHDKSVTQAASDADPNTTDSYSLPQTRPYVEHQLNRWVYTTSDSDITLNERLEKANWEGKCFERL